MRRKEDEEEERKEEKEDGGPLPGRHVRPTVTSFQPSGPQELVLYSLFHTGESAVKRFLPKSHLSKVIIQDNASVQRVQDIKLQHLENSKRKVGSMLDHMKKTFLHDQQKKMARWRKEYQHYQRMLEKIDQRAQAKEHRHSFSAPEAPKAPFGEWEEKTPGEAPPPKEKPASL
ncbi:uncharacterized protein C5orf52 homolog [Anolis carolinensis]|uniref:uncharacterized protein C5orf52 homolog n=1 Tax=Anolis carolinensis TaxID=28377 RepID=UPI002F2B3E6F